MTGRTQVTECGDPAKTLRRIAAAISEDENGCWIWTGSRDRDGYGRTAMTRPDGLSRSTGAHRASWMAHRSDIPAGLQVDHLCRVRACVNPWHMDLVTPAVNTQRGWNAAPIEAHTRPRVSQDDPARQRKNARANERRAARILAADLAAELLEPYPVRVSNRTPVG